MEDAAGDRTGTSGLQRAETRAAICNCTRRLARRCFRNQGFVPRYVSAAFKRAFESAECLEDRIIVRGRFGVCFSACITSGRYREGLQLAKRVGAYAAKTDRSCNGQSVIVWSRRSANFGSPGIARCPVERMLNRYVAKGSHIISLSIRPRSLAHSYSLPSALAQGFPTRLLSVELTLVSTTRARSISCVAVHGLVSVSLPIALLAGDLTSAEPT